MLKKFVEGMIFGLGLAISFVAIWTVGMYFIVPNVVTSYTLRTKEPKFENPSSAAVKVPEASSEIEEREFRFFKESSSQMAIPGGGGLLAMSPTSTTKGSKRPSTYQLWLTESKLWQIRTIEERVEIEELPYPKDAGFTTLSDLMVKNLGFGSGHSTMTVSSDEIERMRSSGASRRDDTLNGSLKISTEGVVFVLPNPYET